MKCGNDGYVYSSLDFALPPFVERKKREEGSVPGLLISNGVQSRSGAESVLMQGHTEVSRREAGGWCGSGGSEVLSDDGRTS